MISAELVDLVRRYPHAADYQCAYQTSGPQRLGCAVAAAGPDLIILTLRSERLQDDTHFYGITERAPVESVTALETGDPRISMAIEALLEMAGGLRESLVEPRLRAWAEINSNLSLVHHGFGVRVDMPRLAGPEVRLTGQVAVAAQR